MIASATCCLLAATIAGAADSGAPPLIGAGGFPLTPMHASAWFVARADPDGKRLAMMFYFEGKPGWHSHSTTFSWEVRKSPATIDMTVGVTPIGIAYSVETKRVRILGQDLSAEKDNVFLVTGIDNKAPMVKSLGFHDLTFGADDNPPLALLVRNERILTALLGEPLGAAGDGRDASNAPAELVALDEEGLDLTARNSPEADQRAFELFRKAAMGGYAPAQYRLGYCYESGRGVKEDLGAANKWFLEAAQQGYRDAQYKLGHSYRVGRGVAIDLAVALHWYTRAAENGDTEAQHNLGMMYSMGLGTEVSLPKAFEWFLRAARNGEPGSQYEVAARYRNGEGTAKDPASTFAWVIILKTQRQRFTPEVWTRIEEIRAAVEPTLSPEMKATAETSAEELLRGITRQTLLALRR